MNSLLLTLDFINDIVHSEGKIPSCHKMVQTENTLSQVAKLIAFARAQSYPIAHVKVGFHPAYLECPAHSPLFSAAKQHQALQLNSWGTDFHESLPIKPEDTIIIKHRVSALYATPLETLLRAQQIERVIVCGVSTNMAVETTVRELHDRDYQVCVIEDACAAQDKATHQASLANLQRIANVITAAHLIEHHV